MRQLLAEIRESSMFCIIADEATDVSHNEQPCVAISSMLCTKTDASTIAGIIKDCVLHIALPISQCCGQAYAMVLQP